MLPHTQFMVDWWVVPAFFGAGVVLAWVVARWVYRTQEAVVDDVMTPGWQTTEWWTAMIGKVLAALIATGVVTQSAGQDLQNNIFSVVQGVFGILAIWGMAHTYITRRSEHKIAVMETRADIAMNQTPPVKVKKLIPLLVLLCLGMFALPASAETLPWRDRAIKRIEKLEAQQIAALQQQLQAMQQQLQALQNLQQQQQQQKAPQYVIGGPPLGNPPVYQIPLGNPPVYQIPLGNPPVYQIPIGQQPIYQVPIGQAPQYQIPLGTNPPVYQIPLGPQVNPAQPTPAPPSPIVQGQPPLPSPQPTPAPAPNPGIPLGQPPSLTPTVPPTSTQRLVPTIGG